MKKHYGKVRSSGAPRHALPFNAQLQRSHAAVMRSMNPERGQLASGASKNWHQSKDGCQNGGKATVAGYERRARRTAIDGP